MRDAFALTSPRPQRQRLTRQGALLSECGRYRYRLWREWDGLMGVVAWVMLNPSVATATTDDPTVRKCLGFTEHWGYGGIKVANLFAYRATDPRELRSTTVDLIGGPQATEALEWLLDASVLVCAWGRGGGRPATERASQVQQFFRARGARMSCLGRNADRTPRHPLMLSYDTTREVFGA